MALLWVDGFDSLATDALLESYTAKYATPTVEASGRRQNCVRFNSDGESLQATILGGISTAIIGAAVKITTFSVYPYVFFTVGSTSYWEAGLAVQPDGTLQVMTSGTGNNMAPGSSSYLVTVDVPTISALQVGRWYYIEWKITVDGAAGTSTINVNGIQWQTFSSKDTCTSSTSLTRFGLGYAGGVTDLDDLYVASTSGGEITDFVGDSTAEELLPEVDGSPLPSHQDWTCNTGTDHGAVVDDTSPDGDTTYLYTGTNVKETFHYPSLSVPNATIHGVMVCTSAKKSTTGTAEFKNLAVPTTVDNQGANTHAPSETSYAYLSDIWETNPDDSSVWTVADINGAEFGVERTA